MNNGKDKTLNLDLAAEAFGMIRLNDDLIAPASISMIEADKTGSITIELLSGNRYSFDTKAAGQMQSWLEARKIEAQRARMGAAQQIMIDPSQFKRH